MTYPERRRPARPVGTWLEVWGSLTPTKSEAKRETVKAEEKPAAKKTTAKKTTKKAAGK